MPRNPSKNTALFRCENCVFVPRHPPFMLLRRRWRPAIEVIPRSEFLGAFAPRPGKVRQNGALKKQVSAAFSWIGERPACNSKTELKKRGLDVQTVHTGRFSGAEAASRRKHEFSMWVPEIEGGRPRGCEIRMKWHLRGTVWGGFWVALWASEMNSESNIRRAFF